MESRYILGMHEPPPDDWLARYMPRGWILTLHEIGSDPENRTGFDHRPWVNRGYGVMARLQYRFGTNAGTIPLESEWPRFALRVGHFIVGSPYCKIFILGNESQHPNEWPGGVPILPGQYAECYAQCWDIKQAFAPGAQLALAPVAPWAAVVQYPGNERGDWVQYQLDVLTELQNRGVMPDAITLHAYTRGSDPALAKSEDPFGAPFGDRRAQFRVYRDILENLPARYRDLPVYMTEIDQYGPWENVRNGYVPAIVNEIDAWNRQPGAQQIWAAVLYRWPKHDQWAIDGKSAVYDDIRVACDLGVQWKRQEEEPMPVWKKVHQNNCELGFYDQEGVGELTVPVGTKVHWLQGSVQGNFNRVEADAKTRPQPEVYEGIRSAALMWRSSTGSAALVSDKIYVEAGKPVRGSSMYQHVIDGGNGGARMGIVVGSASDPFSAGRYSWPKTGPSPFESTAIAWGGWQSTYAKLANRVWARLETPEIVPSGDYIRFICQFNTDDRANSSAGIFDVMTIEQYTDSAAPQPEPEPSPAPIICGGVSAERLAQAFEAAAAKLRE